MNAGLVVVGASLAGLRAVEASRDAGYTGPITLIGAEEHLPYDRPPLSKAYLQRTVADALPDHPGFHPADHFDELGVETVLGRPATALDTSRRAVRVGTGRDAREVAYDALVLATGSAPRRLPGQDELDGVYCLRTLDDALAIRAALESGARVVVVGAGFIGAEIASAAHARGLAPVVLGASATPLARAVGPEMGAALGGLHTSNGVDLRLGVPVAALEGNGHVERVRLADGSAVDADVVVVGIGTVAATGWLSDSGLRLDDGVVCDATLFTGAPGVFAAGDVARWDNPVFDAPMRLEHWTSAAEQGAVAARNALDPDHAVPYATVPYLWSDQYGHRIQFVGRPDADEVVVVEGDAHGGERFVALYRAGDRLVGALALDGQGEIMKYRGQILRRTPWVEAVAFAGQRAAARAARAAA